MRFSVELSRSKAVAPQTKALQTPPGGGRRGWWPWRILESFQGAWQQNVEVEIGNVMTFAAVYACSTLIAADIGKLRPKLVQSNDDPLVWDEVQNPSYSPVLRKPNHYQTRIEFLEMWVISKLIHGNAYILKARNGAKKVSALYPLDPSRVKVLVSDFDGAVFYEINADHLSGVHQVVTVPASEIIHDVHVPLFHPLVGVSPITACGVAAVQGLRIQNNSAQFFGNGSIPSGILMAPGSIDRAKADRLKDAWETSFSGDNAGKIAVLSDGLTYTPLRVNSVDAQLIEQLRWTAENVCTAFHVPPFMIGIGPMPTYNNIEALNAQYYAQCLQTHIEKIEILLDEGLGLEPSLGTELDLDDLLRMDMLSRMTVAEKSVKASVASPNEARRRWLGWGPVKGGNSPMAQQQQYSLAALAERDADKPFSKPAKAAPAAPAAPATSDEPEADLRTFGDLLLKALEEPAA